MKNLSLLLCFLFTIPAFAFTKVFTDQAMTATASSTSIILAGKNGYAIHAVYTGSPVGNLWVEASNNGSTWEVVTGTTTAVSGASSTLFNLSDAQYEMARLKYSFTSGSGTLNAFASEKE